MSASHLQPPKWLSTGHTSAWGTGHCALFVPDLAWLSLHASEQYQAWLHWPAQRRWHTWHGWMMCHTHIHLTPPFEGQHSQVYETSDCYDGRKFLFGVTVRTFH